MKRSKRKRKEKERVFTEVNGVHTRWIGATSNKNGGGEKSVKWFRVRMEKKKNQES